MKNKNLKLILVSAFAGGGKDTFYSEALKYNSNLTRISFADPLKNVARQLLGWDGNKDIVGRQTLIDTGSILRGETTDIFIDYNRKTVIKYINYYDIILKQNVEHRVLVDADSQEGELLYSYYVEKAENLLQLKNLFQPNIQFWANLAYKKMQEYDWENPFIVTDFRFYSEYAYFTPITSPYKVRVTTGEREVIGKSINDRSETEMGYFESKQPTFFSEFIYNDTTLNDFSCKVKDFVLNMDNKF